MCAVYKQDLLSWTGLFIIEINGVHPLGTWYSQANKRKQPKKTPPVETMAAGSLTISSFLKEVRVHNIHSFKYLLSDNAVSGIVLSTGKQQETI